MPHPAILVPFSISPHRRSRILRPGRRKCTQGLLPRLTTVAGANCRKSCWAAADRISSVDWSRCSDILRERIRSSSCPPFGRGLRMLVMRGEESRPEAPRAPDRVRGHFKQRPYYCSETYSDQHTESICISPRESGWVGIVLVSTAQTRMDAVSGGG